VIRVCIVEDQTIVRQGLRSVLQLVPDIEVIAEAADGEEAVAAIERVDPDVVLLDLRMPKLDGVGVLRHLRERGKLPRALVLTTFDDDALLFDAVRAGARGYLLKDVSLERLADAIRRVAAGETTIEPVVTERIFSARRSRRRSCPSRSRSARRTSSNSSPAATATARSPTCSTSPRERSRTTFRTCCRSSACATARAQC
jgi:DNA-binding NarL/FixJ family response regulator